MNAENSFNFWVPADIEKAKDDKGNVVMRVKGIASTDDKDSEQEVLLPVGFELDRFINYGQINWNHQGKNDPSKIIGEPDVARITKDGKLYIEGTLYKGHPLAESVWQYANTLQANGSKRKLGWSIEGRATERDPLNPKRITKALITGVAITPTPVNVNTYVDLCKGMQKSDFIAYEFDRESLLEKAEKESKYLYEFETSGKKYGITKSFDVEEIDKAMDVAATQPLVPESLDKKPKVLEPVIKKAILMGLIPLQQVMDICKGKGEGSKGGKVIGHTKSGKPIYESHLNPKTKHKVISHYEGFTKEDHEDAQEAHNKILTDAYKEHGDKMKFHVNETSHRMSENYHKNRALK